MRTYKMQTTDVSPRKQEHEYLWEEEGLNIDCNQRHDAIEAAQNYRRCVKEHSEE